MKTVYSLLAVLILVLMAWVGTTTTSSSILFGIIVPYLALLIFIAGFVYRVIKWAQSPVPFRIPTTCGQQKSLPWVKDNKLENPSTTLGVIGRMVLEVLFFRSLFRNIGVEVREGNKLGYSSKKWLWLGSLAFHWSMLIILTRHSRFFLAKVPLFVQGLERVDSFLQVGVPLLYITDVFIVTALTYLFARRVLVHQIRYISLPADFFPLFMLLGIAISGILMRYFLRVDLVLVKEYVLSLIALNPQVPAGIGSIFYVHIFLVSCLFAYFPFSKLMHMGGIFLSPTRNLANNSRIVRHINPWNYSVHVHTYEEYEDEFRAKMKKAKIPVERSE